jgi:hypothetical protein
VSQHLLEAWEAQLGLGRLRNFTPDKPCTHCSVVLSLSQDNLEDLRAYQDCKFQSPRDTSAIVVVSPEVNESQLMPYLRHFRKLGTFSPSTLFGTVGKTENNQLYSVYCDPPQSTSVPSVLASTSLPDAVQKLHTEVAPPLTFVLSVKVAGVPAKCLWDTGAATSFMSKGFVLQHGFDVKPCYTTITVATGIQSAIHGRVTAKLKIQKYCHEVTFLVTDMLPQFDLILGNDWSMRHGVQADFGNPSKPNATGPHLKLRQPQVSIYPVREIAENQPIRDTPLLSAAQASRALNALQGRTLHAPFLVMVRASDKPRMDSCTDNEQRDTRLEALLHQYSEAFTAPLEGANVQEVPECVPIQPGSKPTDRPAFRLSMKERHEVETQVADLLAKGWITPSSSN